MSLSSRFVVRSTVALLIVGFLTLLSIIAMTIWIVERARLHFDQVIEARDTRGAAVEMRNALQIAESSQRGFILTGNEIYLSPFDSAKTQAARQLDSLKRTLPASPQADAMLRRLTAILSDKISEMDRTVALKSEGNDEEALNLIRTNRGKALTDEANVFFTGIIQAADERVTAGFAEQEADATMLRWVSILGGVVIVLVVASVVITVVRFTREIAQARDEVRQLNFTLEKRVRERTADLAGARDKAEVLLAEVNHRVSNSLSLVASLVNMQTRTVSDPAAKDALGETQARIYAIASVHRRLYSSNDVRFVALDEYLSGLLDQLAASMRAAGHGASISYALDPVPLRTDASINLGVVVTEWVTNAFKYAYPARAGEVRVRLQQLPDGRGELLVEDDGVGRSDGQPLGTGLGTRIVTAMASTMGAEVQYLARRPGTAARLVFPI